MGYRRLNFKKVHKIRKEFATLKYEGLLLNKKIKCFVSDFSQEQICAYLAANPSQENLFYKTEESANDSGRVQEKNILQTKQTRKKNCRISANPRKR
jgi:hypothetical protein